MTVAIGNDQGIRIHDCTGALEVLGRNDVFPDGTIRRWQYYTRKEGRFLLQEGIVFDYGRISTSYIESDTEEESAEQAVDSDESETDSDSKTDSDEEGDSGSEAESN